MNPYQPSKTIFRTSSAVAALLLLTVSFPSRSQLAGALERSIGKKISQQAERKVLSASTEKQLVAANVVTRTKRGDILVKRWNQHFCKPEPCPLDKDKAATFTGHSYNEIALEKDTVLYRAYHSPAAKPDGLWWKRSPTKGTSAIIGNAIPTEHGNYADQMVKIRVPKGQTIYEGKSAAQGGLAGGDNQVFLKNVDPSWKLR